MENAELLALKQRKLIRIRNINIYLYEIFYPDGKSYRTEETEKN